MGRLHAGCKSLDWVKKKTYPVPMKICMSTKRDREKSLFDANEPPVCSKIQSRQLKTDLEPSWHYSRYQEAG